MAEHDSLSAQISNIERANRSRPSTCRPRPSPWRAEQLAGTTSRRPGDVRQMAAQRRRGNLSAENGSRSATPCRPPPAARAALPCRPTVAKQLLDALKPSAACGRSRPCCKPKWATISLPDLGRHLEVGELIAQNASATAADRDLRRITLSVYKYSSKVVAIPFELLQDSQIDVEAFVRGSVLPRLGRITNTHFHGRQRRRRSLTASSPRPASA
jgi:hypothetical protein